MKLGIIGSNTIEDVDKVKKLIYDNLPTKLEYLTILGGGGKGVANAAKVFAKENNVDFVEFLTYNLIDNKAEFSSKYFFIRNKQLIDNSDAVIVIWNGDSKDVEYGIKYSQKKNLPIKVLKVPKSS
jgi:hypothetical protein